MNRAAGVNGGNLGVVACSFLLSLSRSSSKVIMPVESAGWGWEEAALEGLEANDRGGSQGGRLLSSGQDTLLPTPGVSCTVLLHTSTISMPPPTLPWHSEITECISPKGCPRQCQEGVDELYFEHGHRKQWRMFCLWYTIQYYIMSNFVHGPNPPNSPVGNRKCVVCGLLLSGDGGEDQPGQRGGGERHGEGILGLHARAAHGGLAEVVKDSRVGRGKYDVVEEGLGYFLLQALSFFFRMAWGGGGVRVFCLLEGGVSVTWVRNLRCCAACCCAKYT